MNTEKDCIKVFDIFEFSTMFRQAMKSRHPALIFLCNHVVFVDQVRPKFVNVIRLWKPASQACHYDVISKLLHHSSCIICFESSFSGFEQGLKVDFHLLEPRA